MGTNIRTLTAQARLKPRRDPYWDRLEAGLHLGFRKLPAGSGTWIVRWRPDSSQPYAFHALGPQADYDGAARTARAWVEAQRRGQDDSDPTVGAVIEAYLSTLEREKGRKAAQEARSRLARTVLGRKFKKRQIPPHSLSRLRLSRLRKHHVTDWRDGLVPPDLEGDALRKARASANRELTALLAALNHARAEQRILTDEAWRSVKKFPDTQASDHGRYVPVASRRALLEAAAGAVRDFLEGLILTGARPVGLARATVADYEPRTGTLTLTSYKGRSPEPRRRQVPLRALNAQALVARLAKDKLPRAALFTRDDSRPWSHSDWDGPVREARDRAGLKDFTAYDLRHSFIADALTAGIDAMTVARIVGTSIQMIQRTYGKLIEDHAAQAFAGVRMV